jgi:hypothetical protein
MAISVQYEEIAAYWADGEGEATGWLVMVGDSVSSHLDVLADAIERTNDAAESQWLDEDLNPTVANPPVRVEDGAVWELECGRSDGPHHWLAELARQLEGTNLAGDIRAFPLPDVGRFDRLKGDQRGRSAAVVLALSGWETVNRKAVLPEWKAHPDSIPSILDLVFAFLADEPARLLLEHDAISEVSRAGLAPLLAEALAAPPLDMPTAWVGQFGAAVNRSVSFDMQGRILLTAVAREADLVPQVRRASDLALDWAPRCDWVVMLENSLGHSFADAYRNARGQRLPREYARRRTLDAGPLPDVFPWAILTGDQLPRGLNTERWHVTEVAGGRFVVETANLDTWLTSTPAPEAGSPPVPPSEALVSARRDWFQD